MNNPDDLHGLIDEANSEVETGYKRAMAAKPKRRGQLRHQLLPILPALLFALAYYVYSTQQPEQSSAAAIAAELTALLQQAREDVENGRVDGAPPPVLPNAALAAVVSYQVFGSSYFLSAQSSGVLVEMDTNGAAFAGQIFHTSFARTAVTAQQAATPLDRVLDTGSGLLLDSRAKGLTIVETTGRQAIETGGVQSVMSDVDGNLVQ